MLAVGRSLPTLVGAPIEWHEAIALALPFACLAVLSLVALLGVVAIGGTLRVIGMVTSVLGIAGRKVDDPWRDAVGDTHPLDCVEVPR